MGTWGVDLYIYIYIYTSFVSKSRRRSIRGCGCQTVSWNRASVQATGNMIPDVVVGQAGSGMILRRRDSEFSEDFQERRVVSGYTENGGRRVHKYIFRSRRETG
jgi:cytochrome b